MQLDEELPPYHQMGSACIKCGGWWTRKTADQKMTCRCGEDRTEEVVRRLKEITRTST